MRNDWSGQADRQAKKKKGKEGGKVSDLDPGRRDLRMERPVLAARWIGSQAPQVLCVSLCGDERSFLLHVCVFVRL